MQRFVQSCFIEGPNGSGYFCADTCVNTAVIPTDSQTYVALSGIAPEYEDACLLYVLANHQTTSGAFPGFNFSSKGREVHNEITAGAAMALDQAGRSEGKTFLASLEVQVRGKEHIHIPPVVLLNSYRILDLALEKA